MLKEIFGGLMGRPKETPPPLRKGDLGESAARLQEAFGRPTTVGQGFDRGGWEPTNVSAPKVEAASQAVAREAVPTSTEANSPSNPFSEELPPQGGWVDTRRRIYSVPKSAEHPDQDSAAAK